MPEFQKKTLYWALRGRFLLGPWTCGLSDFQGSGGPKMDKNPRSKNFFLVVYTHFYAFYAGIQKKKDFFFHWAH